MGVNVSKYLTGGRTVDILEGIERASFTAKHGVEMNSNELLDAAAEEIKMLRDRLKGLRQKLAELGSDTDLV